MANITNDDGGDGREKAVESQGLPQPPHEIVNSSLLTTVNAARDDGNGNGNEDGDDSKDINQEPPLPFSKARCIALVATVTGAAFVNTLSIQSVVIILPTIGRDLNIPESRLQWVVSSYSLTFGCFLLLWGRIADIYGKRLIFVLGSVWVTVITAANAFVPNEIAFDLFRGLHGLGSAANVPTAIGILGVTFPPGKAKNYAFSTYAAGAPLGSVFGNLLSGVIAEYTSWKWVFGASAIMAATISVAGFFVIPPTPPPAPPTPKTTNAFVDGSQGQDQEKQTTVPKAAPTVDWIGATLVTTGLIILMFALTEGNVVGWSTPWIPVLIVVSFLIIVAFVFWQRHLEYATNRTPLVKMSMFRNLRFSAAMVIMALFFASFNNYLIYATYFFQGYQGYSPLQTMLRFIPTGVGGATIAFVIAHLIGRVPTVFILVGGNVAMAIASLLFAIPIPPSTSYFARGLPAMLLAVLGADSTWPALTLFTSHALPREDQAIGGAIINAVAQLGRAIGLAISTAIQTSVMADVRGVSIEDVGGMKVGEAASLKGIQAASWMNFGLAMSALAIVFVAFRSMAIVGKTPALPASKSSSAEGVITSENVNDVGKRV